jgi:Dyp-type peroxidase family
MPINLPTETAPFDFTDPTYQPMLKNMQGNILKSHGRDFALHIFFRFHKDVASAKKSLAKLREKKFVLSAAEQAAQTPANQEVFGSVLLSAKGIGALGVALPANLGVTAKPPGPAVGILFSEPMSAAAGALGDTPIAWEDLYRRNDIDGVLIVAFGNHGPDDKKTVDELNHHANQAKDILKMGADILGEEFGHSHLLDGEPREQFGFVDGISQPIFIKQDLSSPAPVKYDPSDGLVNLIVADPFTTTIDAFGSFFVFRKLEQNVKGFRESASALATEIGVADDLGGAYITGRFLNGDPVMITGAPLGPNPGNPPNNDFDYADDPTASKCPFQGHIRKTNPRTDVDRIVGPTAGTPPGALNGPTRNVRIARRGITYGTRNADLTDAPEMGVGLLFMCYQANIPDQFGFMQQNWVNDADFVNKGEGQDADIGLTNRAVPSQAWPSPWGTAGKFTPAAPLAQFVTNKGGEFFFAPSIATIEAF